MRVSPTHPLDRENLGGGAGEGVNTQNNSREQKSLAARARHADTLLDCAKKKEREKLEGKKKIKHNVFDVDFFFFFFLARWHCVP